MIGVGAASEIALPGVEGADRRGRWLRPLTGELVLERVADELGEGNPTPVRGVPGTLEQGRIGLNHDALHSSQ